MLSAGTDKTRANEGEKFWQGIQRREPCIVQKISHRHKGKAVGDKTEQRGEGGSGEILAKENRGETNPNKEERGEAD